MNDASPQADVATARSDLVKAAAILGACTGVAILVASVVIVVGVRWALASVVAEEVTALRAELVASAAGIESSVDAASGRIDEGIADVSDRVRLASDDITSSLGEASSGLSTSLDGNAETLSKTLLDGSGRLGERIDGGAANVSGTLAKSFEVPLLVSAPQPLPLMGTIGVRGPEEDEAVQVEATLDALP